METTINRFVRGLKESKRNPGAALVDALFKDEARRVRPDELLQPSPLWGSVVQVMHAWLVGRAAKDWLDEDRSIDSLARNEAAKFPGGDLTAHHIFARDVLAKAQLPAEALTGRPTSLLSRSTNAEFGAKTPDEVLHQLDARSEEARWRPVLWGSRRRSVAP
ncbi:MAG: hypothetical protein IPL75_03835 [Acidobacteria bacterium]|nr:hypothetical protein [Acidobacteriota bacterium]